MVCKEDVLLWFKDLESYKRIDVMYELLNMCIPFEVRFLGSCIEEIGKHTFQELRGPSIIANDVERLTKDPTLNQGLLDETSRHRAVIYMSVLSARNCSCANWFYRTLFRTERIENFVNGCCKDDNTLSELLLLFTLCLYHPAFTFEQKIHFGKLVEKLIAQSEGNKYNAHNFLHGSVGSPRSLSSLPLEAPTVPVKSSSVMPGGDTLHIQHPPPGLPPPPHALIHPPIDFIPPPIIGRSAFPATVVGAPEVHPFPPQPVSPLVSQTTSPPHSRATSPHRTFNMRPLSATGITLPPPLLPTIHPGDSIPSAPPLLMEPPPNSQTPSLPFNSPPEIITIKNNEEDVNHIADDKLRDIPWINQSIYDPTKQPNGIRMYQKYSFVTDQMQGLKLEGDNSLHCSSSASSNSSINQSPTETPSVTPAVTPHGPGRGTESKSRVNGMPTQFICDINAPPPPPFSNCTVPSYSISHVPQNRYYAQTYRPHFTTPFPYQQNEVYTVPSYLIYSSMIPPPPPRNPNCYNCGGMGHSGVDCNGHTVEDITQKPYMLEYDSPTLPDNPPDK